MNIPVDVASVEAAMNLEIKKAREKAEAERENSLQEEVRLRYTGTELYSRQDRRRERRTPKCLDDTHIYTPGYPLCT